MSSISLIFCVLRFIFLLNDTSTPEIYTFPYTTLFRSWCEAAFRSPRPPTHRPAPIGPSSSLPICSSSRSAPRRRGCCSGRSRSEEHTSELQSLTNLVCRLLLEKKKKNNQHNNTQDRRY